MQSEKAVEQRGYHHTPKELSDKDNTEAFREQILSYNHDIMRTGYCMRHCTRCGVGIRLMFYKVYYFRYYDGPYLCERCKKIVGEKRKPFKEEDKFVSGHGTGFRIHQDGTVGFDSLTLVGG